MFVSILWPKRYKLNRADALSDSRLQVFFYSLEEREPIHIHVEHAGRYAKFWLDPVTLASNRGFRSRN